MLYAASTRAKRAIHVSGMRREVEGTIGLGMPKHTNGAATCIRSIVAVRTISILALATDQSGSIAGLSFAMRRNSTEARDFGGSSVEKGSKESTTLGSVYGAESHTERLRSNDQ